MSRDREFEGRVALITGAGTGMGAATAELLALRGACVVLVGRREAPLRDIADKIEAGGGEALVFPGDVSSADTLEKAVAATVDNFGALHLAVNNAGGSGGNHELPDVTEGDWNATLGINLSGIFYGLKYEIPAMLAAGGGAIVNVSSVYADRGLTKHAAYAASKHGIRGLTRSAAFDWASRGIRINELQPGVIDTPLIGSEPSGVAMLAKRIPAGRIGKSQEIAQAIAFLLSDEASYITGAHLAVDGGFLA